MVALSDIGARLLLVMMTCCYLEGRLVFFLRTNWLVVYKVHALFVVFLSALQ